MKSLLLAGMLLIAVPAGFVSSDDAQKLSEMLELPGVDRFVSQQVQQKLVQEMGNKIAEWGAEGLHALIGPKPGSPEAERNKKIDLRKAFAQNPELSRQLKGEIQKRLEAWIPKQMEKTLADFMGSDAELKEIKEEVLRVLNTSIRDQIGDFVSSWYDPMISRMLHTTGIHGIVSPSDFGAFFRGMGSGQAGSVLSRKVGDLLGGATVKGLQNNILKAQEYLPSAQFAKLKNRVMGLHIVDLPNQAYGGILAASAAMHLAKFSTSCSGFFATCNWNELKRFKEVTETMIWQLRNKKYVSFNLGDFTGMIKMLGDQAGGFNWGALKQMAKWNPASQFLEKLDWIEKQLQKIDALYDKAAGKMKEGFEGALAGLQGEMEKMSRDLLGPLKLPCLVEEGCPDLIPDKTPLDYLRDFYADSGLQEFLQEVNWQIAGELAETAVAAAELLHVTGPLAEILDVEEIPPQNPSDDSDFEPVFLHNGEFYTAVTDVTLPGGGLPLQFTRIYRSRSPFLGGLGYNWTHNFAERLLPWESPKGPGYTYVDGEGKKYFFRQTAEGFLAPPGLFLHLQTDDAGFLLHDAKGGSRAFDQEGRLLTVASGEGEKLLLVYDGNKSLIRVEEEGGQRSLQFFYRRDRLLERVEDFTGRVWKFDYDKEHNLIAAASPGTPDFPKGKTSRYHYDDVHRLILAMDPRGQFFLQNYFGVDGKVVAQQYGDEAAFIEARYDGKNTWVRDRRGIFHLYEHDEEGHLLRQALIREEGGEKTLRRFEYNRNGLRTAEIFPSGRKIVSQWEGSKLIRQMMVAKDGSELLLRQSQDERLKSVHAEPVETYQYDVWGNIISITDAAGKKREFDVDASNHIAREVVDGEERHYRYDANDNIIRMEVPQKNLRLEFEYDILDRMTAKREILNGDRAVTARHEYDPQGRPTRFVYPMGNENRFVYDDEGRLVQSIRGFGTLEQSVEQYEYDDDGRISALIDGEGNKTLYFYDRFGRPVGRRSPMGNEMLHELDAENRVTMASRFDANRKLLARERWEYGEEGVEKHFRYLFRDNPKKGEWVEVSLRGANAPKPSPLEEDSVPAEPATTRDSLGRPLRIGKAGMEWDDNGRLASLTAENGEKTAYAYDALNRLVLERYPDGTEVRYAYDNAGRLSGKRDRAGRAFLFEYDPEGRLVERRGPASAQSFRYDGLGRLAEALDLNNPDDATDDIRARFLHDSLSRTIGEALNDRWVYKNYDKTGNKTAVEYPSGLQAIRQFDAGGSMAALYVGPKEAASLKYSEEGLLEEIRWGNGVAVAQSFDPVHHLTLQRFSGLSGEAPFEWRYVYNAGGNLEKEEDGRTGKSESHAYDAEGKWIDPQPAPAGLKRENDGFLARNGRFSHRYDDWGRLTAVEAEKGEAIAQYTYDVFGRVAKRRLAGEKGEEVFSYDEWETIEIVADSEPLQSIFYADHLDTPLMLKNHSGENTGIYFYHQDRIGSVRFLTDAAGRPVEWYDYSPHGERAGESRVGNELGFAARPQEEATGLVNLRNRYYAPALRAFLTPDPLGYKNAFFAPSGIFTPRNFSYHRGQGGASRTTQPNFATKGEEEFLLDVDLFFEREPLDFPLPETDLYAYAGGDPVNFFDPLGLYALIVNRSTNKMKLYDMHWEEVGLWEARTEGQHRDWSKKNGDTPTGLYSIDPNRVALRPEKTGWPKNDRAYGEGKINMNAEAGNAWRAEKQYGRSGFAIHGGGTRLGKQAFDDRQGFVPTQGCIRMQNEDVVALINAIDKLKKTGDTNGSVEVLDLGSPFADLDYYRRNSEFSNFPFPGGGVQ